MNFCIASSGAGLFVHFDFGQGNDARLVLMVHLVHQALHLLHGNLGDLVEGLRRMLEFKEGNKNASAYQI